jgi:hypothetical protein
MVSDVFFGANLGAGRLAAEITATSTKYCKDDELN